MEQEGLGREIEIYNEPADKETEPLLPPTPQAAQYENFRVGREPQQLKRWIMPALFALKISFWSLGMRGYRVWKYITYTLLVMVCAYYIFFKAYCDPLQSRHLRKMDPEERPLYHAYQVAYISNAILAMASILSCLAFIGCCMVNKRKTWALMCPSEFMIREIDQVNLFMLFLAFLFMIVLLTTSMIFTFLTEKTCAINCTNISGATVNRKAGLQVVPVSLGLGMTNESHNSKNLTCRIRLSPGPEVEVPLSLGLGMTHGSHNSKNLTCRIRLSPEPEVPRFCEAISSEDSTQFFLHFVSLNICHIFAAVCMVLGKLTY